MSQRCWTLQSKSKYFQYSYKDLNFISCDLAHLCVRFYLCTFLRMCTLSLMSGGGVVLAENVCQTVASAELCNSSCVASVHYCYQFRLRNSSNSWCCTVSVCHSSSGNRFKVKVFGQTVDQRTVAYTESSEEPCRRAGQLIIVRFAMSGDMLKG